jgi:mercuric reductase
VDGEFLTAGKIIITTGTSATIPLIDGIDTVPYLTSTEAFELDQLPESIIVIGGGVIGCEVGQMFARFGSRVTILCRSRLLSNAEPEISENLEQHLQAEGITVVCGAVYKSIKKEDGICLCYEHDGETFHLRAQHLLIATGRHANTQGFGLEELGVEIEHGNIVTNENMQTTHPHIYAAGDVTGHDLYVYMAAYGGKIAAINAINSNSRTYDASSMPHVVFTDPQAASVGLTEQQAVNQGIKVKTSVLSLDNVPRALAALDTRGLIKLVAEVQSKRLVGAHILAPEGADSIQTMAIAIKQGLTVEDLADTIFPYLTTVEGLKLAAQTFDKDVSKLSCCAG